MEEVEIQTLEQPVKTEIKQRGITIGLPRNPENGDRRFPLTPEAVRTLVDDYEFKVFLEAGAGNHIHYSDNAYSTHGALICSRAEALRADIVISAPNLTRNDIDSMRRNATLWTVTEPSLLSRSMLEAANSKSITIVSLPALAHPDGHKPVDDILSQIDGRAAVSVAAGFLADGVHGKGILLGGVTGIVPCEIVIIGGTTAGIAAARSGLGLGALVRMFDNDLCRLRSAEYMLTNRVVGSSLHRNVYLSALRTADIVINTLKGAESLAARVDITEANLLKKGAILFDFNREENTVFPSMRHIDLAPAVESMPLLTERTCFVNPGNAVPRTSAMALSNAIVPLLAQLARADDRTFMDAVRMNSFLGSGLIAFGGKLVNLQTALATGMKWVDPAIFLNLS